MREVGSITTHACVTAVKQRRLCQIVCTGIVEPVPVWLVTLIAAFFTKCCLVGISHISVPRQEVSLIIMVNNMLKVERSSRINSVRTYSSMDRECLVDMHSNEVVISCNRMLTPAP